MSQTVLAEKETNMANSTFSGPVRSEGGFNVINKAASTGVITETGFSVNSTGQLVSMGTRKIQSFAGTLASTNAASTAYGDGDVLVELGALDVTAPDDLVTPSKFFIHRAHRRRGRPSTLAHAHPAVIHAPSHVCDRTGRATASATLIATCRRASLTGATAI